MAPAKKAKESSSSHDDFQRSLQKMIGECIETGLVPITSRLDKIEARLETMNANFHLW